MERCKIIEPKQIDSNDVYYSGEYLPNLDINTQATLTTILQTLDTLAGINYLIKGGINTQTADGLTTVFNIPHTLGSTPNTYSVEAASQNSASNFSVTTNSTNLIITYPVAPSQDALLSWSWQVIKL